MIRVAFLVSFSDRLLGSLNYFRNLLEALNALENRQIEPVIITGYNSDLKLFEDFPATEIIKTRLLNRKSPGWLFHKVAQRLLPRDLLMENLLRKHRIDLLSHSGSLGRSADIKTIGWIPDFQHKHIPELFSRLEIFHRDKMHRELCENCSCMVVSSYDALNDMQNFYPGCIAKTHVLQFVAGPLHDPHPPDLEHLQEKYKFSGPYFLLPNQFWVHKNHQVVIEALGILKNRGVTPLVILTGKTSDHRQPEHFNNLMAEVEKQGLSGRFRVLGVIPYNDLVALIRNALALINPSLFEGWSSSVEEAKSLGKKIILSDIPIHREQDPAVGDFFKPHNAVELAEIIEQVMRNSDPDEEQKLQDLAKSSLSARKRAFAEQYQGIVLKIFDKPR